MISQSMYVATSVFCSALAAAVIVGIDTGIKKRARRRRLLWDSMYQHNALMTGYDQVGTEGRYPTARTWLT